MAPSPVWQYFEKLVDGRVKCQKCLKHFKYNHSTTSLSSHLKNTHKIEFSKTIDNSENAQETSGHYINVLTMSPHLQVIKY